MAIFTLGRSGPGVYYFHNELEPTRNNVASGLLIVT